MWNQTHIGKRSFEVFVMLIFMFFHSVIQAQPSSQDPLERTNRLVFSFNEAVDKTVTKPAATLYNKVIPRPLNHGIHNIFNNFWTVTTIANDMLQLHLYQMMHDTWRFAINTTVGVGGFFDVADRIGLKPYTNDFGLTLARWGWQKSTYVVWPFFGPSSIRDGIRLPVDYYLSIYPFISPVRVRYGIYGLDVLDRRAQLLKFQPIFEEAALDKYVFMRDAYSQRRQYQISENLKMGFLYQRENGIEAKSVEI